MTTDHAATPPRWAELLLRMMLAPKDRDSVSGDLLEEYRESIVPSVGRGAGRWYLRQVAALLWRRTWPWAMLLAASVVWRDTLDWWISPTNDFHARSVMSTAAAVGCFTAAGLSSAWLSRSVRAGAVAGCATGALAAVLIELASLAQLAVRHDAHTMRLIAASGGLGEVFLLPLIIIVPGTLCAILGGIVGKAAAAIYGASRPNTKSA